MSEKIQSSGILTQPVEFRSNEPLPPRPENGIGDPQNLWHTIDMNQRWIETGVLGLGGPNPYKEPGKGGLIDERIGIEDIKRTDGNRYTDCRGLDALAALLHASDADVANEFKGKRVLDIGSGVGKFSNDLRLEAGAHVTEVDFSSEVLSKLDPIPESQGSRVIADGTELPFQDSSFEATVSMYSVSVHTNSVRGRLTALTETLRVTAEDGKAFIVPLFAGLGLRQQRWVLMHNDPRVKRDLQQDPHMKAYEKTLRQEAAMDYAVTDLIRALIVDGSVEFTPILAQQEIRGQVYDNISGIFRVKNSLPKGETSALIDKLVGKFS